MAARKKNIWLLVSPFLALFAAVLIVVMLIRSAQNSKANNVPFLEMLWYEIKFLFSLRPVGSVEVGELKKGLSQ